MVSHTEGHLYFDSYGNVKAPGIGETRSVVITGFALACSGDSLLIGEANAQRVVKCWNMHEELLDALKGTVLVLSGEQMGMSSLVKALETAMAVIAKCEEPSKEGQPNED